MQSVKIEHASDEEIVAEDSQVQPDSQSNEDSEVIGQWIVRLVWTERVTKTRNLPGLKAKVLKI